MLRDRIASLLHRRAGKTFAGKNGTPDQPARAPADGGRPGGNQADIVAAVRELVPAARIDTQYADQYLDRARSLLAPAMDEAAYRAILRARAEGSALVERVQAAIEQEAWDGVRTMSARLSLLHGTGNARGGLVDVAQPVYEFAEELADPFSPGLTAIAGVTEAALPALRDESVRRLERLQQLDPEWGDLYRARRAALTALQFKESRSAERESPTRAQAAEALRAGDYALLERIASKLGSGEQRAAEALRLPGTAGELTFAFSPDTVARAARLGLTPIHVASARHRVEGTAPLLWRPMPYDHEGAAPARVRLPRQAAPEAPEALRERIELYFNCPLLTSGGTRDIPSLADEDVLVEAFDEPAPGAPSANPALLEALALPRRNGVSRAAIERALLLRGQEVVRQLALDPRDFRLVCIPPDLHLRIGETRRWGTQPIWTHLDGRMVLENRKFLVLAGGHSQFGGIYDLVGVGRDYDSERLFARFAVVLRRRMSAW